MKGQDVTYTHTHTHTDTAFYSLGLVLGHEFILKSEIFEFKRAMFAKLFGVRAPFLINETERCQTLQQLFSAPGLL